MSATLGKSSKMLALVNYRMRVTLQDGRALVGVFMAFDKHMNMILGECEEFRQVKAKRGGGSDKKPAEQRRYLGLVLLRGENVVSLSVAGPPKPRKVPERRGTAGTARGVGRGSLPPQVPAAGRLGMPPAGMMGIGLPPAPRGAAPGFMPPAGMGRGRGRGRQVPAWQLNAGSGT